MRSKNRGLMEQIKTYAEEYAMSHGGATPSTRDIGAAFNMSHVSAYRYLRSMDELGMIRYEHGEIRTDRTVFEIAPELGPGDMILKGANALFLSGAEAGTLIGHPQGGTIIPILAAAIGRRVQIVVPIGLEKRVEKPIPELARLMNSAGAEGPRLCPLPGRVYTELDAVQTLTGAHAELLAAGGALGAEGAVYLAVTGEEDQLETMQALMNELRREPASLLQD